MADDYTSIPDVLRGLIWLSNMCTTNGKHDCAGCLLWPDRSECPLAMASPELWDIGIFAETLKKFEGAAATPSGPNAAGIPGVEYEAVGQGANVGVEFPIDDPADAEADDGEPSDPPDNAPATVGDKDDRPNLAKILGVQVGQRFNIKETSLLLYVDETGRVRNQDGTPYDDRGGWLYRVIDDPGKWVVPQTMWTLGEVTFFKFLQAAGVTSIIWDSTAKRGAEHWKVISLTRSPAGRSESAGHITVPEEFLPNLKPDVKMSLLPVGSKEWPVVQ